MSQASDARPLDSPSSMTDLKPDLLLSLPDVPTLSILSLLPLQQVIVNVPLVHSRLAPFRESVLTGTQEINQLGFLQTLSLDIGSVVYLDADELLSGGQAGTPLRLSILGQLRQFSLHLGDCPTDPEFLLKQLEAYATEKLTSIGFSGDFDWDWSEVANSPFAGRFANVPFSISPISIMASILPFISSLTSLTVYGFDWQQLDALKLVALFGALSPLSHLQCLKMYSFCPVSNPFPIADLPSLPSVTVLEIEIYLEANEGHRHLQASFWETLFPSVQILKVTHFGHFCALCYPDNWNARLDRPDYAEVTPCLRQLFAPLAVLPSLRKIFYQRREQCENIAEFTPKGEFVGTHEFIG